MLRGNSFHICVPTTSSLNPMKTGLNAIQRDILGRAKNKTKDIPRP